MSQRSVDSLVSPVRPFRQALWVLLAGAALALCVQAAPAAAQDDDDFDVDEYRRFGFYGAFGFTVAHEDFDDTGGANIGTAIGVNFAAGLRGSDYAAFEVEVDWVDAFEIDGGGEVETLAVMLNAKLHFPLGRIEPFLFYGAGALIVDPPSCGNAPSGFACGDRRSDLAIQGGGGVDIYLNSSWALTGDVAYVAPFQGVDGLRHVSATFGLKGRF